MTATFCRHLASPQQTGSTATTPAGSPGLATKQGRVAVAPIIGPPNTVTTQLTSQLSGALRQSGVETVPVPPGAQLNTVASDYFLRGFIVAAKEAAGTKVSYIWDVTNKTGNRVHRITGEEVIAGAATADPWASVTPQHLQKIATQTAASMKAWLPDKKPAPKPVTTNAVAAATTPATTASTPPRVAGNVTQRAATTGSLPPRAASSGLAVVVPRVSGAPGDGSASLSLALQNELRKNGIKLASGAAVASAHRVEGKVVMGKDKGGKQPISIDWVVKDPRGAKLGTVSQNNEVAAGSLNGKWGPIAGAAAAAAAQGIVRLLPTKTAARAVN